MLVLKHCERIQNQIAEAKQIWAYKSLENYMECEMLDEFESDQSVSVSSPDNKIDSPLLLEDQEKEDTKNDCHKLKSKCFETFSYTALIRHALVDKVEKSTNECHNLEQIETADVILERQVQKSNTSNMNAD